MAGNYMDAPAHRLAYDRDGSVGVGLTAAGVPTQLTLAQLQAFNSESETGTAASASATRVAIVFPIPVDLKAVFVALASATPLVSIETSKDTTTGVDGTWTQQVAAVSMLRDVRPNYRTLAQLFAMPGGAANQNVRGVRISAATSTLPNIRAFHLYGDPASTATPDRIAAWDPSSDIPLSPIAFDWGNVPRSSSADRTFRIKNISPTLTAHDIEVYVEALTPGTPSVSGMHTLSDNGGSTYLSSITISSLAPGAISPVLRLRRVVPSNAQVSVWSARVAADVTTWS